MREQTNPKLKGVVELCQIAPDRFHVFDPSTFRHFCIGSQEAKWLKQLDGRPIEALHSCIPSEVLDAFIAKATRFQLLEGTEFNRADGRSIRIWHLLNPNHVLAPNSSVATCYRHLLDYLSPVLFGLSFLEYLNRRPDVWSGIVAFHSWTSLAALAIFYAAAIIVIGFCHEISHAAVARSFGVNVPSVGVALSKRSLNFYADVSGIYFLRRPIQRMHVLLGGLLANSFLMTSTFLFSYVAPRSVVPWAIAFAWLNAVLILINLAPFPGSDGYYLMQELSILFQSVKTTVRNQVICQ